MPVIIQSNMRRMTCRDPGVVKNYTLCYEKLAKQHNLLEKTLLWHLKSNYPHNLSLPIEYEKLDTIRCKITRRAEQKCRKLWTGQIAFSPKIWQSHRVIKAWTLLQRRSQGRKVRWYLISRSVKKAGLQPQVLHLPLQDINAALR